jgi:uncharacterized protein YcbK (DUF882 family)
VKLTPNFTLEELEASNEATRKRIENKVPNDLLPNMRKTAEMLQRIRDYLSEQRGVDIPITVSSGYRSLLVNRAIGSSDTSDHVQALAVDWRAPTFGTPTEICKALAHRVEDLQIGQLINEYPGDNGWVHAGARQPRKMINRVITITHNGTSVGVHAA